MRTRVSSSNTNNNAIMQLVTSTIRLRFDACSMDFQLSVKRHKGHSDLNPLVAVTVTYLFIYAAVEQPRAGRS